MVHNVHVIDHPLVQHKLTLLRRKETSTTSFRRLLSEIGSLMAYEVTRDVSMHEILIETPMETMQSRLIDGKKLVFVPILRAGTGLLEDRAGAGTWNLLSGAPATLTTTTGSCTGASPTGGFCPSPVTDNAAPPNTVGAAITLRLRFRIPETDSFQAMTFTTTIAARN